MTDVDDFFVADGPTRDRWGRPLLIPRGGTEEDRRWYTRASSLADMLADFSHLWKWKMRYLARSLGYHRDLAMLAAAEPYTTGFDKGDDKDNRASGARLDTIIERALERGKIHEKADYGTAVHAWTEPENDGVVFDQAAADVKSFKDKVAEVGATIIGTEVFTACDLLWSAGTFDHLMYVPGYGIVITDKKTSAKVHGHDFAIQLSGYANSDVYDWETDARQTLEEYVASLGWDPALINRTKGLIFWIKNGQTTVHEVDLVAGLEAAHHAIWVRDVHRKGTGEKKVDRQLEDQVGVLRIALLNDIRRAPSAEALGSLWNLENASIWTDAHTEAALIRKGELANV